MMLQVAQQMIMIGQPAGDNMQYAVFMLHDSVYTKQP